MKTESRLRNNLREVRTRLGMSQQDVAALAGVTRQTISGVESDLYTPSAAVAMKIARALGCRVEDLFWFEEDAPEIEAAPARGAPAGSSLRVALGRVGGRWVAHPLIGDQAFRTEMIPADGVGTLAPGASSMRVRLLDDLETVTGTVILAGCSPATSLWVRAAQRWNPGLRVHWVFANSTAGLEALRRGEVHAAGVHLHDPDTGEHNVPFVRRALPDGTVVLVNLGTWEEGLLVQAGNPLSIRSAADLAARGVRIVNREPGAGSRGVLEHALRREGVPTAAVSGFDDVVTGHLEVAQAVASGRAHAGVSTAAVAAAYGLGFVPLLQVRYDIAIPKEYLDEAPVRQLLSMLNHRRFRAQLEALGGYDIRRTGDIVATVEPAAQG
ncbi:molybdate-binding protein/DNA-binding XRE family transcriptional regulator [Symbiobacterium terraclitae]|uniref:Molybdate-binding protein/DNA-binding XRE family transcriptional regulator n=1 Tax=Symbiobacterium terraclitae TaxID=557451 RepID=A0ABS4JML9_9FIRM|nr:molybdate-binding protein/DNA-binding XRE family transcriptional regulator [Symbiobacterium terraclitae]